MHSEEEEDFIVSSIHEDVADIGVFLPAIVVEAIVHDEVCAEVDIGLSALCEAFKFALSFDEFIEDGWGVFVMYEDRWDDFGVVAVGDFGGVDDAADG